MKTASRFLLVILILAALTGGWFYLYTHSRAVSSDSQNATLDRLKDLKQLDSDWNTNVLKAQTEIIRTYDPLSQPLAIFASILSTLDAEMKVFNDAELKREVEDIRTTINKKTLMIDRFKAQNSLLKNSLRYMPTAYQDIQTKLRVEREAGMSEGSRLMKDVPGSFNELEKSLSTMNKTDSAANASNVNKAIAKLRTKMNAAKQADVATRGALTLVNLDSQFSTLVGDALHYNTIPDTETADRLKIGIEKTRGGLTSYPTSIREDVENLMSHLEAILNLRTKQIELLKAISQVPVIAKVDILHNTLTERFNEELKQQYNYQQLLLAYSAFALLLVFGTSGVITYRSMTERERLVDLVDKQTKELKENEVQLVHAQKMNALGEMVAGITHEVNTPLAAVKSGLQSSNDLMEVVREYIDESGKLASLLSTPNPADEEGRAKRKTDLGKLLTRVNELGEELTSFDALGTVNQLLKESIQNVDYIHQVVVNMLNFSRLDRSKISAVKIEEGIESTLTIAKHFLKNLQLTKRFGDTQPVNCDIAQLNQVLLNLIKNSAQAMPGDGGEIIIETSMASSKEVRVVITDNGTGVPADIQSKIWEPFFTTKKAGSGTGLGLSTCAKIIKSHGGQIEMQSEVGKGTTFTITLPIAPPSSLYEEHGQEANSQFLES
ncbi:MAG: DAHL domain-containing protein [Pseudomonadota bacterium]